MITRNFNLFLNSGVSVAPFINVNQYDYGEQWVFTLYEENGILYKPATSSIVGVKSDGGVILNSGIVNNEGKVIIMETQQMTSSAGDALFELVIDSDSHGTANFIVRVERKPGDETDLSESDMSYMQEKVNEANSAATTSTVQAEIAEEQADRAQAIADEVESNLAEVRSVVPSNTGNDNDILMKSGTGSVWSNKPLTDIASIESSPATSNHAIGDYIMYNGTMYRVTATIASGNSLIIGTNIVTTSAGNEIKSTNVALTSLDGRYTDTTRRTRENITNNLANLSAAVAEQNLAKYGYSIGDYFIGPSGYSYHLGDEDTFYGGYNSFAVVATHHISIVVNTNIDSVWNNSNSTSTGYVGSVLHSTLTGTVLGTIRNDFKQLFGGSTGNEHLLTHSKIYTTAISNWAWSENQYISALTEPQVYGTVAWSLDGFQIGEASTQLEIFRKYRFNEIIGTKWWWLRTIQSASNACAANGGGRALTYSASDAGGVVGLILFH